MALSKLKYDELLTQDQGLRRYTLKPIKYHDLWNLYKKALSNFWITEEIDLSKDIFDWKNKLTENERQFIIFILGFFASGDGVVNENIVEHFSRVIKITEAKFFYGFQIAVENIHAEMYSLLIDTYIEDEIQKDTIFKSIETMEPIKIKLNWMLKYIENDDLPIGERIIAFACVEGLLFQGSFCAIYWLMSRDLLPGLSHSNEFIARDEALHYRFALLLYNYIINKPPIERVSEIISNAVNVEKEFLKSALPINLLGMNYSLMSTYVEFVADRILIDFGCPKKFNVKNPFDFMEKISLELKTNFFEKHNSDYRNSRILFDNKQETGFSLDAEF